MTLQEALQFLEKPFTTIEKVGGINCNLCKKIYRTKDDFDTHYINHNGCKEIVYQCVVCSKEFLRYSAFRGHCYTNHVIKNRFMCTHCNKFFSKQYNLQQHIELVHGTQCKPCMKRFNSKKELHLHQIVCHSDNIADNTCQVCKEEILTVEACKEHIDLHLSQAYSCPICQETIHKNTCVDHLKKHFWKNNFDEANPDGIVSQLTSIACGLCSMIFYDCLEFDMHFSCDHPSKNIFYTCILCGKQFDRYSEFHRHANNHYVDGQFRCDTCDQTFPTLSELVLHVCACSQDYKKHKPYVCFQCGNRYLLEHSLLKHITNAHNGFDLRCKKPGCEQIFDKRRELLLHSRQHSRADSWCRVCGQDFVALPSCALHLEVHKKNLYACPLCSKSYAEMAYLLKHVPTHFRAVLHVCKTCGKVYEAKRRLLEHQQSHRPVKRHGCSRCPKTFAKKVHLLQHLGLHDADKEFECVVCHKRFSCAPNLSKHQSRVHCVSSGPGAAREARGGTPPADRSAAMDTAEAHWDVYLSREADVIDEDEIEKESRLFESQERLRGLGVVDDYRLFGSDDLDTTSSSTGEAGGGAASVPPEYGPDIAAPGLDEAALPHIDPLLTILTRSPTLHALLALDDVF